MSASLLSLAFADRHRRGFDLPWKSSSLCGSCESVSLISPFVFFVIPPHTCLLSFLSLSFWSILILLYLLLLSSAFHSMTLISSCFSNHLLPLHLSLTLSPLQSDLLHRKRPWPAGTWPWLKPQPPVLLGQLRRWLQGQVLGCPQRSGACKDPGGPLTLVRGLMGESREVWERVVSGVGPWSIGPVINFPC